MLMVDHLTFAVFQQCKYQMGKWKYYIYIFIISNTICLKVKANCIVIVINKTLFSYYLPIRCLLFVSCLMSHLELVLFAPKQPYYVLFHICLQAQTCLSHFIDVSWDRTPICRYLLWIKRPRGQDWPTISFGNFSNGTLCHRFDS